MFPESFVQRVRNQQYINADKLVTALGEPSPVSIRINPSKWSKTPVNAEPVTWCRSGYYISSRPSYTLDPLFHSGCYYPQEASSMFLEQALLQSAGPLKDLCVLDLCGAPGGKSTHLSDLIGHGNLLVSNEVIRSRAIVLAETLTKWGSANTLVTQNDPAAFGRLPGYFDIILVDAPCSGEGMFRTEIAINEWSPENASHCSERQKRIIKNIWSALKEDGILIYSTCTFNPGENEENIKWLIDNHEAECLRLSIDGFTGVTEIDYQGIYGYGFYPYKVRGEGFFISVIRKKGKQHNVHIKSQRKKELDPGKNDIRIAGEWSSFPKERLIKWRDEVIAVPCNMEDYLYLFSNLKIEKAGSKMFTIKNNDYLPSHELVLSNEIKQEAFPCEDVDLSNALAFLRRDIFSLQNQSKGWNIVTYKGVNLGLVKNLGNRANNYFPVEWRIRMNLPEKGKENLIEWSDERIT